MDERDYKAMNEELNPSLRQTAVSCWVAFDWNKIETRPTAYGKYLICRKDGISYAVRYIRSKFNKIKWIQSFADERCGGFGIVYQGANFVGLTTI
jgi:hypothetical protein